MKKDERGITHILLLAVIGAMILIAVAGNYVYQKNTKKPLNKNASNTTSYFVEPIPTDLAPINEIKKIATESTNLTVVSVELKKEGDKYIYAIKLSNGTILYFDAKKGTKINSLEDDTKEVTKNDASTDDKKENESLPEKTLAISYARAREIALSKKPGGIITKIELDNEGGITVYKVQFTDEARYYIDANTGSIVKSEPGKTETKTEQQDD